MRSRAGGLTSAEQSNSATMHQHTAGADRQTETYTDRVAITQVDTDRDTAIHTDKTDRVVQTNIHIETHTHPYRQTDRPNCTDIQRNAHRQSHRLILDAKVPKLGPVNCGIRYEHGHSGGLAGLQGCIGFVLSLLLRPCPLHQCIKLLVWAPRAAHTSHP